MRRFLRVGLALTLLGAISTLFMGQISTTNPGMYWVPASACQSLVSGNSTGTQGLTVVGASNTPVDQAGTSSTGTNTHTYICNITPPNGVVTSGIGYAIRDAVFAYGLKNQIAVGSATLASGTMNGSTVFSYIAYPTAGASETPSTATPVRADTGTLTIAPAVASFNVNTTTDGEFYTVKFTPSTPIAWKTDQRQLLLTVTLQGIATTAVVSYTPGVLVHLVGK